MANFWIFNAWWLFHHIFITMVWKWVLKNIVECVIPSNSHKNVMDMWCQEKNKMQIEISIFQNNSFFSIEPPPINNLMIFLNDLTCFYKIFTIKMKHFVDYLYPKYLNILLNLVTLLVCYCFLVPLSDWSKNAMVHSMAIENGSSILSY